MTIFYSNKMTNDRAAPPVRDDFNKTGGCVRIATATYTLLTTEVAADVIHMVKIPAGAIVQRDLSTILWSDLATTTCTFDVGDLDDDDRYCSALVGATASAARTSFEEAGTIGTAQADNEYSSEATIVVTLDTVDTLLAGTIYLKVFYTMNG